MKNQIKLIQKKLLKVSPRKGRANTFFFFAGKTTFFRRFLAPQLKGKVYVKTRDISDFEEDQGFEFLQEDFELTEEQLNELPPHSVVFYGKRAPMCNFI